MSESRRRIINSPLDKVFKHEGGYQANKEDTGNYNSAKELVGTNFGISAKVYEDYLGRSVTADDMKKMTKSDARLIYSKNYIPAVVRNLGVPENSPLFPQVLDLVVNHGYGNAAKIINGVVLNDPSDNKSGPKTRAAIQLAMKEPKKFNNSLVEARLGFYNDIIKSKPDNKKYIKGWTNRAKSYSS